MLTLKKHILPTISILTLLVSALNTSLAQQRIPSTVEAVATAPNSITVYWERLPGATGYRIYRDGMLVTTSGVDTDRWTDTSVEAGKNYLYNVVTQAADGAGPPKVSGTKGYLERSFAALPDRTDCDVLVVGATTAGVAAAVTAARYGLNVVLIEETRRLGGMPVNGLGETDLRRIAHSSGFFEEFRQRVQSIYGSGDGLKYEPRVAHQAIKQMVWAEPTLTVHREVRPVKVLKAGDRIETVIAEEVKTGRRVSFRREGDCRRNGVWGRGGMGGGRRSALGGRRGQSESRMPAICFTTVPETSRCPAVQDRGISGFRPTPI